MHINWRHLPGIFSGGPIGLSSRLRFFFFSTLSRPLSDDKLSDRLLLLLCSFELVAPVRFSPLAPALLLFFDVELIGVIVMDDLRLWVGCDDIGTISIPGLPPNRYIDCGYISREKLKLVSVGNYHLVKMILSIFQRRFLCIFFCRYTYLTKPFTKCMDFFCLLL